MSLRFFGVFLGSVALTLAASAQPAQQSGGAMQGFQMNRDQPVKIESSTLEVRIERALAYRRYQTEHAFLREEIEQGSSIDEMIGVSPALQKVVELVKQAQKGSSQQIKRAEAKGDVLVTQKDQTARGDNGVFDVKTNSVTLTGNVVVTQGTNVLRGDRMVVDLNTGVSRVESDKAKRVEGLFNPSSTPQPAPAPAASQKDAKPAPTPQKDAKPPAAAPPAAKAAPGAPTRIN